MRTWRLSSGLAATMLVLISMAGCRTSDREQSVPESRTLCPTSGSVAKIINSPTVGPVHVGGRSDMCGYQATHVGTEVLISRVQPKPGAHKPGQKYAEMRKEAQQDAQDQKLTTYSGLGDDARFRVGHMTVRTSTAVLFVTMSNPEHLDDPAQVLDAAPDQLAQFARRLLPLGLQFPQTENMDCAPIQQAFAQEVGAPVEIEPNNGNELLINRRKLQQKGCDLTADNGRFATVQLADPSAWDSWLHTQEALQERYVPVTVSGHNGFQTNHDMVVDDGAHPLKVTILDTDRSQPTLDKLRIKLVELVLK